MGVYFISLGSLVQLCKVRSSNKKYVYEIQLIIHTSHTAFSLQNLDG